MSGKIAGDRPKTGGSFETAALEIFYKNDAAFCTKGKNSLHSPQNPQWELYNLPVKPGNRARGAAAAAPLARFLHPIAADWRTRQSKWKRGGTMKQKSVLGIILGDHAGSSPEMAAKTVLACGGAYIPVLIGNRERFGLSCRSVRGAERLRLVPLSGRPDGCGEDEVYFCDVPAGPDIRFSTVTADSGRLMYDSMRRTMELERAGILDGFSMAPITKAGFHAAGLPYSSEFEVFAEFYQVPSVTSVIKCEDIFRSTVVGHCAFRDIVSRLSADGIVKTGRTLRRIMGLFLSPERCRIAVAALNPHAGEDGLFGDEELTIITPAIEQLRREGLEVIGPCPADTVFLKARNGEVGGVVFLYHDQGNIAMKSCFFGDGVLIYTNTPAAIVSVGHGPAYGKAGKGTADPKNLIASMEVLRNLVEKRGEAHA
jgi:4-hydroxy-L-threonine phosphate dehydrogenase PdxA